MADVARPRPALVALVLARREILGWLRRPARVGAAVGTPALLWLFLASGFADTMRPDRLEGSYAGYLLPGMMALVAVFASIYTAIGLIEERQGGWLQAVLASPAPRWSIAAGKTLGGGLVAAAQAALLLPVLVALEGLPAGAALAASLLALALTASAVTSLGLALAWRCATVGSFHAVMNLVLVPTWLLSGALFPAEGAAGWLRAVVLANPLTWCTRAIRAPLAGDPAPASLALAAAFAVLTLAAAAITVSGPEP